MASRASRPNGDVDRDVDELHLRAVAVREARTGRRSSSDARSPATSVPTSSLPQVSRASLPVAGMTCRSCEVRIERSVRRIQGVTRVAASASRARVDVESAGPVPASALAEAIRRAGYEVGATPWIERSPTVWATAAAGAALVMAVAGVAAILGVGDLAESTGDLAQGGLAVALLLGLAAGVSTCMALVGGLVLGLTAAFEAARTRVGTAAPAGVERIRPALVFVAGRVIGYGVFGALLGAVGAAVTMPPQLTAGLMVTAAVVMTLLGIRLTGLSPRIAGWTPALPPSLAARLGLTGDAPTAYTDSRAALLGAATFLMPCGFTQAVQIYALSTGSPAFAGLLLAVFALGTAPGLLALAGLPVLTPSRARPTVLRLVGVAVLGFAILNVGAGFRLAGVTFSPFGPGAAEAAAPLTQGTAERDVAAGSGAGGSGQAVPQELRTYQDLTGYLPANAVITAGVPTRWVIESLDARSCASFLVVPDLGIQVVLHKGDNVIELPALSPGVLGYTCSMGMYGGTITVADPEAAVGAAGG